MRYHSILLQLAELYIDTGQAAKAIAICQIALGTDHLLEEAYRINMRACALVGDLAAVARIYRTCQETLFNELGIKPSKETESLYKQLV
jgi:two-component SAPR family response regulator